MCVGGHTDAVEHALVGREDVGFVVGFSGVGHCGEFEGCVVFTDDAANVVLVAKFPVAKIGPGKLILGGLVAEFHVVDARLDAGVVDGLDEIVLELVGVDQATVTDGAVEHLYFRAECHPRRVFFRFTHDILLAK